MESGKTVITFGTFDVFHVGHLSILERARALGSRLIVGISSDEFSRKKKGRPPVFSEHERSRIIKALKCVDDVFLEHSLEDKRCYMLEHRADILVMGNDWEGRFDEFMDICEVVYLSRTPSVSTTAIIEQIRG